jgi:hypothetical protein
VLSALQEEIESISSHHPSITMKKRNFIFLIGETDLSPHSGALDEGLASLFEHQLIFSGDKDEKLERRQTLDWLIRSQHGKSCVDGGII